MLTNYYEKWVNKDDTEKLAKGDTKYQKLGASPEEIFPDELVGENKNTPELINFINNERRKGNANVAAYQNELHLRTAMPFSIIILTFWHCRFLPRRKEVDLEQTWQLVLLWPLSLYFHSKC